MAHISSNYYGQPSYGFTQPPVQQYSYQYSSVPPPPPPAPVYHVDPATFRSDYSNRLRELTQNNRPIIQNLSMLAHEYSRFAEIVAQCLEAHIRSVPAWMKLPAFYLLDMISKNIYDPYARHFTTFIVPLFLESYALVDNSTRGKMEELVLTWRTGSPIGKELFGVAAQVSIERGIWSDGGTSHNSANNFPSGSGQITRAQVLSELEFILGQKERAVQTNPYDANAQLNINILHQLRKLVEAGVSQPELQQILGQLHTLGRTTAPPPAPPQWPPQPSYLLPPPPPAAPAPTYVAYAGVKAEPLAPAPISSIALPPAEISNILSSLMKSGLVSATVTPSNAPAIANEEQKPQNHEREAARAYRADILSQNIQLTTSDITKKRPRIPGFLYDRLSVQCKQCGIRFHDSVEGKKSMASHLDFHFKQNRKASQNVGRGHSRSWFVGIEDWIHDMSDVKGKGRADGSHPLNAKASAAEETAKRDAELRAQFVVVPPGDEAKLISCPICKEILKSEFLEEDEDWVWKNAIKKDDRVYHATCHAEALASTTSLAARLRSELGGQNQSRSSTPVSRQTPPRSPAANIVKALTPSPDAQLAGTKRKADDSASVNGEHPNTPPMKKVAMNS